MPVTAMQHSAGGTVDMDVIFRSAAEIVNYIPRALEIALLSPFQMIGYELASVWIAVGLGSSILRPFRLYSVLGDYFGRFL